MQDKFTEMFNLQNTLNTNTSGAKWTDGITNKNKTINWYRCIYMEAAEAIDSCLNWKHWKDINSPDDIENLKIELVDIWHFVMSQMIVDLGVENAVVEAQNAYSEINNMVINTALIETLEGIIRQSILDSVPLHDFFIAVRQMDGFTMDDVYKLYIGKNCLNQFRQDNGYKEGTYLKIWNGKEDNVYMQKTMNENPNITYDDLYASLKKIYVEMK
jgi:dimeric dUTPase (all-alpha-NTP-PPase superfamily)